MTTADTVREYRRNAAALRRTAGHGRVSITPAQQRRCDKLTDHGHALLRGLPMALVGALMDESLALNVIAHDKTRGITSSPYRLQAARLATANVDALARD